MGQKGSLEKPRQYCRPDARIARSGGMWWKFPKRQRAGYEPVFQGLGNFKDHLFTKLGDSDWWAGEVPSWLLFVVLAGFFSAWLSQMLERRRNEKYQGWRLIMVGYDDAPQQLYFEEVREFLNSDFELWKFVKSVVSGACLVKLRSIEKARGVWSFIDIKSKTITVDFEKIPDSQIQKWSGDLPAKRPVTVPDVKPVL